MALTEEKIQASVETNLATNTINVRWDNVVKRDGEIISRIPHRKAYAQDQAAEFVAEVSNAQYYISAMGW